MSYIDRKMAIRALKQMASFEGAVNDLYSDFGLEFRSNLGRRNSIVSQSQEVFFSHELSADGHTVVVDGRTGEPDIVISDLDRELECKLTSGRNDGKSWSLQTDYATISQKGELDYLYVLADGGFDRFAVLFFDGLTSDDFHPPAPGAREKGRMNKALAMKKCYTLVGSVTCKNKDMVRLYGGRFKSIIDDYADELHSQNERLLRVSDRAVKRRENLIGVRDRMMNRYLKKLKNVSEKRERWKHAPLQFSIALEEIERQESVEEEI